MTNTTLAERPHIVISGIRNAGKSSLMNHLLEKESSLVSSHAGTTTDPVTRAMELGELGPVALVDTAGFDDVGTLGEQRVERTAARQNRAAIHLFVSPGHLAPTPEEISFIEKNRNSTVPLVLALTWADKKIHSEKVTLADSLPHVQVNNTDRTGVEELKKLLIKQAPKTQREITPLEGLVKEGDLIVLVTPIDLAAPKGRLIQPQVQTIRDALDRDCAALVVKERELASFYRALPKKPKLVITDSQAFSKVAADIPPDQPLTSFSILFARKKGELDQFLEGLRALDSLRKGSRILVMESCSHHRQGDDIATVKIPRLYRQLVDSKAEFHHTRKMPDREELKQTDLIIHCAACSETRQAMLAKMAAFKDLDIPVTNFGLFLGWVNGLLPRAVEIEGLEMLP